MSKGKETALSLWRIRFGCLVRFMGRIAHYGFVPLVLYLGIATGQPDPSMPELSLRSLLWQ